MNAIQHTQSTQLLLMLLIILEIPQFIKSIPEPDLVNNQEQST